MRAIILALLCTSLLLPISQRVNAVPVKTDFVFMIDATSSMGGEIAGVKSGFSSFVGGLDAASVDARFSIVLFGGPAEIVLDFTSDATDAQSAFDSIVIGSSAGFQNNHNLNPEAGLEVIRMVLAMATNNDLQRNNVDNTDGAAGPLIFRSDARKNLILVTDEDSDCPYYAANDVGGSCSGVSPQAEVDATAQAIIDSNAFINMLINTGDSPSAAQYGDYQYDVSDSNLLNYDVDATLQQLLASTVTENSLQAQVLQAGLLARTFNVAGANDADFVNNFFAAKIQEVVTDDPCDLNPNLPECNGGGSGNGTIPIPGTVALLGLGLAGLGWSRRKKA